MLARSGLVVVEESVARDRRKDFRRGAAREARPGRLN